MQHLDVNHGYLINFPHDDGFPSITQSVFRLMALSENVMDTVALNATTLPLRHDPNREEDPQQVQIVRFQIRIRLRSGSRGAGEKKAY